MIKHEFTTLSGEQVANYEQEIDAYLEHVTLPASDHALSKWYLLTVADDLAWLDSYRIFQDKKISFFDAKSFSYACINNLKSSLKYALDLVYRRQPFSPLTVNNPVTQGRSYKAARRLLRELAAYDTVVRAFTAFHYGRAECYLDTRTGTVRFEKTKDEKVYGALDLLMAFGRERSSPLADWISWFITPTVMPAIVYSIASRAISNGESRITYTLDLALAKQLRSEISKLPEYLTQDWSFPWCTAGHARAFLNALALRCLYHFISIHYGAEIRTIRGVGVDDLCFVADVSKLTYELCELAELDFEEALGLVRALTYGVGTRSPDPALQPFMPADASRVLIPALFVASTNWERDLLTLHARVDPKSFDSQSCIFERRMTEQVKTAVKKRYSHFCTNIGIPGRKSAGEVDLLLADPTSRMLLIGELRWMLEPAEPKEIHHRKDALRNKSKQLRPKLAAAREQITSVLQMVGVREEDTSGEWLVRGIVVADGFCAQPPDEDRSIPLVPIRIFTDGIENASDLRSFYQRSSLHSWLPQEGLDFVVSPETVTIGNRRIEWYSTGLSRMSSEYLKGVENYFKAP